MALRTGWVCGLCLRGQTDKMTVEDTVTVASGRGQLWRGDMWPGIVMANSYLACQVGYPYWWHGRVLACGTKRSWVRVPPGAPMPKGYINNIFHGSRCCQLMFQQKNPALPSLSMLAHFPRIHPHTETPWNLQTSVSDLHSRLLNPSSAKFQRRQVVRSNRYCAQWLSHSTARSSPGPAQTDQWPNKQTQQGRRHPDITLNYARPRIYTRRYSRERKTPFRDPLY